MRISSLQAMVFAGCISCGTIAGAVGLPPGGTIDTFFYDDYEIVGADPEWFGTPLGVYSRSATETRDGFDGFEIIEDLYVVTGVIDVAVWRSAIGDYLTFQYGFSSIDDSGTGDTNGVAVFSVSGFMGYDVEFGWNDFRMPYVPAISRSGDGDTITVDYFDPTGTWQLSGAPWESILLRVSAPGVRLTGTGTVDINIDSFGVTERTLEMLPVPAEVPLPLPAVLLAGGLGLLGAMRTRKKCSE